MHPAFRFDVSLLLESHAFQAELVVLGFGSFAHITRTNVDMTVASTIRIEYPAVVVAAAVPHFPHVRCSSFLRLTLYVRLMHRDTFKGRSGSRYQLGACVSYTVVAQRQYHPLGRCSEPLYA